MPRALVYTLYNLLLPFVLLVGLPSFLVKGIRRGGLARNFRQRLGFLPRDLLPDGRGRKPLWIHAVSVGEVFIALKLADALRAAAPGQGIVLSTTTTTGYAVAAARADGTLAVIHNPVDLPLTVWSVLRRLDPSALVLVESEIWPNLVGLARLRGIPVLLANARLSPRSERRYRQVKALVAPVFSQLSGLTVPFDEDRDRWAALGIDRALVETSGSVKFDNSGPASLASSLRENLSAWLAGSGMPPGSRILLGGSTHEGEERLLAATFRDLSAEFPDLRLVLVPRHAERGAEIAAQLSAEGFTPILRAGSDRVDRVGPTPQPGRVVWIANTTGELRAWFDLAELVVIGKSFHGAGGQNPVEPILAGRPVVVGPHMENFAEVVAELCAADGLRQLAGEEDLATTLRFLLLHPDEAKDMATRGAAVMARHAGAAARNAAWILERSLPSAAP